MPDETPRFIITPDTKVGELLARYPQLEEVLVAISPTYQALRNPVLRRTVAKVATLRQVAKVGNVPLGELIGRLRSEVGLEPLADGPEESTAEEARPPWASAGAVVRTLDARPLIESGGHPLPQVIADLATLEPGQVYELLTPFVPAPLIDVAKGKGFVAYSSHEGPGLVRTYLSRPNTGNGR
ncbi:MAG: DUF1858 domain-containing protein [Candidatus Latescibacterota bacterium]|jgi:hypothetical protein